MNILNSKIRFLLLPFSWLYGIVVSIRNWLYDSKIFKQKKFDVPVICVGNITVGGTGKTPHIEYLIELLSSEYKVGVLSRGYKRKSKGFKEVHVHSKPEEVGDEPLQIKQKFPEAFVYVDKDRRAAIDKILSSNENRPDLILLDDGYQHRRVTPSLSILLVDSHRPIHEDYLLPVGRLREPFSGRYRASIVIYTKCKIDATPLDLRIQESNIDLYPFQKLYFTTFEYGSLKSLIPNVGNSLSVIPKNILLVTGIASPQPLIDYISEEINSLHLLSYPDHHFFNNEDIAEIVNKFKSIDVDEDDKIIVTTEKDATRLRSMQFEDESIKRRIFYIPINVVFLKNQDKDSFNKKIFKHVRNYQTNG